MLDTKILKIENYQIHDNPPYIRLPQQGVLEDMMVSVCGPPSPDDIVTLTEKTFIGHRIKTPWKHFQDHYEFIIYIDDEGKKVIDTFVNTATAPLSLEIRKLEDKLHSEKESHKKSKQKVKDYEALWFVRFYNWLKKKFGKL